MVISFTYWSDPLCVWAYAAQDKLDRVLDEFGDSLEVDYRVAPIFGSVPHRLREGSWAAGGVEGRIAATCRIASRPGGPAISGSVWATDCPASSWSPGAAVKAVSLMERAGQVRAGSTPAYLWALRRRFFEDDVNIARRRVQLDLARALELDTDAIEDRLDDGSALAALFEDHQERLRARIQGSPTYVFDGGRAMLYGNFSFRVLRATVEAMIQGCEAGGSC